MAVLSLVLPAVKDVYGPFWSAIFEGTQKTSAQADLFALYASLRLLNLLRRSHMLESNDDLLDAWSEKKTAVAKHLVDLLCKLQGKRLLSLCELRHRRAAVAISFSFATI